MTWAFGCLVTISVPGNLFLISHSCTSLFFLYRHIPPLHCFSMISCSRLLAQAVSTGLVPEWCVMGTVLGWTSFSLSSEQPSLWSTCFFQQHQSMLRDVPMKALPHWLTHGFEELQSCVAASSSISALLICIMQRTASDHIEVLLQFIYNYRNSDEVMDSEVLFICVHGNV